jgi:predicted XRE-type DNA-binding protein
MIEEKDYTVSSDNIFADHSRINPEERLMRTELSFYIVTEIKRRGLSQCEAAALFGISESDISLLLQAKVRNFSLERLLQMVTRLGINLTISGEYADSDQGHMRLNELPQFA